MQKRLFGNTKREVAVIGQGTWYNSRDDRASAIAALRRGIELGMTHIDTTEMYLSGRAEEWVREAISCRSSDRAGGNESHSPVTGLPAPLRILCRLTSGNRHP